jgi:hypothetical protein
MSRELSSKCSCSSVAKKSSLNATILDVLSGAIEKCQDLATVKKLFAIYVNLELDIITLPDDSPLLSIEDTKLLNDAYSQYDLHPDDVSHFYETSKFFHSGILGKMGTRVER